MAQFLQIFNYSSKRRYAIVIIAVQVKVSRMLEIVPTDKTSGGHVVVDTCVVDYNVVV
ncbi:MAG: hypothetical protein ABIM42_03245 [candidate division WOR-3 bacterium]